MKRISLLLIILAALLILSCPVWAVTPVNVGTDAAPAAVRLEGSNILFFRKVIMDNRGDPLGRYPVSETEAKQTKHSKLFYNNNKLVRVESYDGYGNRLSANEYIYSRDGLVVESRAFGSDGSFLGVYRYKYDQNNLREEVRFYGINDTLQEDYGGIAIWRYKCDKNCDQIQTKLYDSKGRLLGTKNVKYNDKHVKTETEFIDEILKETDGAAITIYKHDRFGNNIEESLLKSDGTLENRSVYKYDKKGYCISMDSYGPDGKLISTTQYKYNINGDPIENRLLGPEGNLLGFVQYKYNQRGNMTEYASYGADEKLIDNGIAVVRFAYDEAGNLIRESNHDAHNRLMLDENGVAVYTYKYDEKANIIEEGFRGADDLPLDKGVAFNRFKYDDRNRIIEESYFDAQDKPEIDFEGVAMRKYQYADVGDTVTTTKFDTAMNIIKQ